MYEGMNSLESARQREQSDRSVINNLGKALAFAAGIYAFPKLIRACAEQVGFSWLSARPISNTVGMLLAVLTLFLVPPIRQFGRAEIRYLTVGAIGSTLFLFFSALFLDNAGNYVGKPPFAFALAVLASTFFVIATLVYWTDGRQRKLLGCLALFSLILAALLAFLTLRK